MSRPLRVVHLVTLISPDGAYGGPVRVAVNQVRELMAKGHEVTLATSYLGYEKVPAEYDGVPVKAFPARRIIPGTGFAGLTSPSLHSWLRSIVNSTDVFHVHLARDLVTLPAANIIRASGRPYVLQTHGMVDRSSHPLATPLDKFLTVPVLRGADRVFHLTERERSDLVQVGGPLLRLSHLVNGVPSAMRSSNRPSPGVRFLYLARLHERKRPQAFVRAAISALATMPNATFDIFGPDEGEGEEVRRLIRASGHSGSIRMHGGLRPEDVVDRMRQADVYVLPSVDEPFPMAVLEAMSVGLPVVVTDQCGLAPAIRAARAGLVVDDGQKSLNETFHKVGTDSGLRFELGRNALELAESKYSMTSVVKQLTAAYREARE